MSLMAGTQRMPRVELTAVQKLQIIDGIIISHQLMNWQMVQ